jgi:hypothetical protein
MISAACAAGIALSGAAAVTAISAGTANAVTCPSGQFLWAVEHQSDGKQVVDNADNFGGGTACLTNSGGGANFTVASQGATYNGSVRAYPNTDIGAAGGYCSTSSGLPVAESGAHPLVTWSITPNAVSGSRWDAGIDSFFASSSTEGCSPTNTGEVIVYINASSFSGLGLPSSGTQVSIGGYNWYRIYRPSTQSRPWPLNEYALAQGQVVNSVSNLDQQGFYADAIANNNLPTGQYLTYVATGFEIWNGGAGLVSNNTLITGV